MQLDLGSSNTYGIAILILLGVYARAGSAIGSHCLIPVLSEVKNVLLLIIVYTLDHLRAD